MIFKKILLLLNFIFILFVGHSQGIRGQITNSQGEPVPFANIYVPEISTGTSSNIEGNYELKLPEGKWIVLFQYLGYQTQRYEFVASKVFKEVNIELITQDYRIPEIKVLASGEDPAYYIMRRAIAMAPYYQNQVSKYSCKVYLKGSGIFEKIPFLLEKQMKKSGVKENEPIVLETVSQIDFELPNQIKQKVLAMRSSGQQNNTSPMGMITNNLYDADKYGIVSPVGKSALRTYDYKLAGVFEDQGRTINKIKVIPKIKGKDVFTGYIFIADLFWNIHSADLNLNVPMTAVNFHQVYAEVNKNTWMPVSIDFDMDFSGLGMKVKYKYVASISEYKTTLNPKLDHAFIDKMKLQQIAENDFIDKVNAESTDEFKKQIAEKSKTQIKIDEMIDKPVLSNRETVKLNRLIEKEAERSLPPEPLEVKSSFQVSQKQVNNDSSYWASLRPIPLTELERVSFLKKDTFLRKSSTPEYKDSVFAAKRRFKIKHLIFGKTYDYSIDSSRHFKQLAIPNLSDPTSLSFNSVDGVRIELPFSLTMADSTGRLRRLKPHFAYAFSRKKLDMSFEYRHRFDGIKNAWYSAQIGSTTEDYNRISPLTAMTNDIYTLWREENLKRLYRRDFINIVFSKDLVNGFNLNYSISYNDNIKLNNNSEFKFIDYRDKQILPNIPVNKSMKIWQLDNHQSIISNLAFEYTPQKRYRITNNVKRYVESRYPTFSLVYKSSFSGIAGSDSRFDLVKIGIKQNLRFGIGDQFNYGIKTGTFLNSSKLFFEDFEHFNTQSTAFMFSSYDNSFRLLPFYTYSTQKSYAVANGNLLSRRLLLKHLPLIRNSAITENLFTNVLFTNEIGNYAEVGYGLKNIFLLLNVEAVAGFENGKFSSAGFKFSLNLN